MTLAASSGCTFGGGAGAVPSANVAGTGTGDESSSGDLPIPGITTGPGQDGDGSFDGDTTGGDETPADSSSDASEDESGSSGTSGTTGTAKCTNGEWWDTAWSHRRGLRINNEDIGEALADFPVLIRLTAGRINYARTQDDGADIRFVSADGVTVFDHEIEVWNEIGDSFVWVKIPTVAQEGETPTAFHLYFGNEDAPDTSAPASVWSNGYTSVHHMGALGDSTETGHDGVPVGGPMTVADGLAGPATAFDGIDDYIALPHEDHYDFSNELTVEAHIRMTSFGPEWQAIVTKGNDAWRLQRMRNESTVSFTNSSGASYNLSADTTVDDGVWHGVAMSLGGDEKRVFVDGGEENTAWFILSVDETDDPVTIGYNTGEPDRLFQGDIDEVRVSSVERSPTWLAVSHRSMRDGGVVNYDREQEICVAGQ